MFLQTLVVYQANQRKASDTSAVVGRKWKQDDGGADVTETKWTQSEPGFVTTELANKSTALKPSKVETSPADFTCPGLPVSLLGGR
jgi:hypothetical protein